MHRLRVETARDGSPTPMVNDTSIHSAYRPVEEGEKLAQRFLEEHPGCARVIVFGLGFGYHILPLLNIIPDITVYEPLPEMLTAARELPHLRPVLERVRLVSDPAGLAPAPVLALPAYRRLLPDEYAALPAALTAAPTTAPAPDLTGLRVLVDYPVYGGSHTTARYVEGALRRLGCHVRGLDNAYADGVLQRILSLPDRQRSSGMAAHLTGLLSELYWEEFSAFKPHLALFLAQAPVTPELLRALNEKTGALTAFWFVEDYRRFGYWRDYAPRFAAFFGIQKGAFTAEMQRAGAPLYGYLPMAADDAVHRPLELNTAEQARYGCDVAFMGAGYPNRHTLFSQLTHCDLKLWGNGWEGAPALEPFVQDGGARVSPEDTAKIYNAARININLHSSMNADIFEENGDFVNPRTFEIMACGGFQLVDRRTLLPELFTEDEDIACFGSLGELREKIAHYLARPEERERIARNGRSKVLAHHTYVHRMQAMLGTLLRRRPDWAARVAGEQTHREDALRRIADPALNEFLADRPAAERDNIAALAAAVREDTGPLQPHQATLLALDTFRGNE